MGEARDLQETPGPALSPACEYTLRHLAMMERRIHQEAAAASGQDAGPLEQAVQEPQDEARWLAPFPSMPVPADASEADWLRQAEEFGDRAQAEGTHLPLRHIAATYSLSSLEVQALLTALAAECDPKLGQ
ncbi:MAG: hypothetical protein ACRDTD_33070, partial [Pseudonocardiaceae bacterium]